MPFLQKHPDSFRRDVRSLPNLQFAPDLPQQIQSCVPVLPVLQLNAMVFSRHSDAGEPGEDTKKTLLKLKHPTARGSTEKQHGSIPSLFSVSIPSPSL